MSLAASIQPNWIHELRQTMSLGSGRERGLFGVFYVIILAQITVLACVSLQTTIPLERLFRDTIAVAEEYPGCCHVYDGLISNLGILLWWTAASVTAFAALLATHFESRRREIVALSAASLFSAWLASDDLFMLHESVFPLVGLTQPMTYAIYGAIVLAYIALSWRTVFTAAPVFLIMAIAMLGASVSVDILADHDFGSISKWLHANPRIEILLDDGFKFLGIGAWCCLHLAAAARVTVNAVESRSLARAVGRGGNR